MKDRIYKFDTLKVVCMIMVVMVHTLNNSYGDKGQEMVRFLLLCYTMPLFTYISGYLSRADKPLKGIVQQLLIPCIVFTCINDYIMYLVSPKYAFSWLMPGFAMWYLWVLFVYRVLLRYLIKIPHIVVVSFILSWVVGFIPSIDGRLSLSRMFCFLPFFLLGYMTANGEGIYKTIRGKVVSSANIVGGGNILDCSYSHIPCLGTVYF